MSLVGEAVKFVANNPHPRGVLCYFTVCFRNDKFKCVVYILRHES